MYLASFVKLYSGGVVYCRYLMDPNMEFIKFFGKNVNAELLCDLIVEETQKWKP